MPSMPPTVAEIITPCEINLEFVQRIASRTVEPPITILRPNPEWPQRFEAAKRRIQDALGSIVVDIAHTGSTSVPGLPAKDIIDIDLIVKDSTDEASYVEPLERAGFLFLLREPPWYEHRFFVEKRPNAPHLNVHVWSPDSPEVARHRIFRDWLLKTPADRELYAKVKYEAAEQTVGAGDSMMEYTHRKEKVILEILDRAYRDLGYIE